MRSIIAYALFSVATDVVVNARIVCHGKYTSAVGVRVGENARGGKGAGRVANALLYCERVFAGVESRCHWSSVSTGTQYQGRSQRGVQFSDQQAISGIEKNIRSTANWSQRPACEEADKNEVCRNRILQPNG